MSATVSNILTYYLIELYLLKRSIDYATATNAFPGNF